MDFFVVLNLDEQTEVLAIESSKDRLKSIKGSKIHTSGLDKIVVKDPLPFVLEIM